MAPEKIIQNEIASQLLSLDDEYIVLESSGEWRTMYMGMVPHPYGVLITAGTSRRKQPTETYQSQWFLQQTTGVTATVALTS